MGMTSRALAAIKPGKWLSDGGRKGAGRLAAFGMARGGAAFYFRYTRSDGTRDAIPLGHFDEKGSNGGLTLRAAAAKAGELSRRYQDGARDLRELLDREARDRKREEEARQLAEEAAALASAATLGGLLGAYVAQLELTGKISAKQVERALYRHVRDKYRTLWDKPARDISAEDMIAPIGELADLGKNREAAKLRAYLRAAYAAAASARTNPQASESLRAFRIVSNPLRDLGTISEHSNARERSLSLAELRAYWRRIQSLENPSGALLRLHLLTGGQRIDQLCRVQRSDVDTEAGTVTLYDSKGRRRKARAHIVPLLKDAKTEIKALMAANLGPHVFSLSGGESPARYHSVRLRASRICAAMLEAGEVSEPFTVGDLRRTVETRLASGGVSAEVRAQLQSHGLGGIQARHYDRHDYIEEKREALQVLRKLLNAP